LYHYVLQRIKNMKKLLFLAFALLFLTFTAPAQRKFNGRVVDVIDGRTVVLALQNGTRVDLKLQFIEIPEPEQALHDVMREHLKQLVLGKVVEFDPRGIGFATASGQLYLQGIDIGGQMLRDGAAWLSTEEKPGLSSEDAEMYALNEKAARTEKLGVWSVAGLKPAWEFRAEKEKLALEKELAAAAILLKKQTDEANAATGAKRPRWSIEDQLAANSKMELWPDVTSDPGKKKANAVGLFTGYDPEQKAGYAMTSVAYLDLADGETHRKVEYQTAYFYKGDAANKTNSAFVVGIVSEGKDFSFLTLNNLTVTADGQKIALGKAKRFTHQADDSAQELLLYKTDKMTIARIAKAKNLSVRLGTYSGAMTEEARAMVQKLLTNSL
jgi:endonuclease YncB( thermonuclease family)